MGKIILASLLAGALGSAATLTVGQTYYSTGFQWDFPIGGAFKVTPDLANVWHWEGDATPAGTPVMVDFNADGIMDTECADVRVCITDVQNDSDSSVEVVDSSGTRWILGTRGTPTNVMSFTTPIVLPLNSPLTVRNGNSGVPSRVYLIGRIVNI